MEKPGRPAIPARPHPAQARRARRLPSKSVPRRPTGGLGLRLDLSLLLHPSTRTSVGAMAWRDRADDRVVHAQRACRLAHSLPGLFGRQAGTKMPVGRAQLVVVGGGAEPPVRTEEPAPTVAPSSSGRIVTSLPMARPVDQVCLIQRAGCGCTCAQVTGPPPGTRPSVQRRRARFPHWSVNHDVW